jgi:gamma-glutamyl-gamma-aminobutyrate hydrolase PuuD
MGACTDETVPVVLVTSWQRRGTVWGDWPRDVVGSEVQYLSALQQAGAHPMLSPAAAPPPARALLRRVDGVVVIGGEDVHAEVSGVDPLQVGPTQTLTVTGGRSRCSPLRWTRRCRCWRSAGACRC